MFIDNNEYDIEKFEHGINEGFSVIYTDVYHVYMTFFIDKCL